MLVSSEDNFMIFMSTVFLYLCTSGLNKKCSINYQYITRTFKQRLYQHRT